MSEDDGRCRFNCRTAKENWMEGYMRAVTFENRDRELDHHSLRVEADIEYQRWLREKA